MGALATTVLGTAVAGPDPVPITAEQAFDAVTTAVDPFTGKACYVTHCSKYSQCDLETRIRR